MHSISSSRRWEAQTKYIPSSVPQSGACAGRCRDLHKPTIGLMSSAGICSICIAFSWGVRDEVDMVGSTCTRGGVGMPGVWTNMHPPLQADPLKPGGDIRGGSSQSVLAPQGQSGLEQCPHDRRCGMAQYQHQTCIAVSCRLRQTIPNQCKAMTLLHSIHPLPCRWDLAQSYGNDQLEHLHDVHPLETHHFARCDSGPMDQCWLLAHLPI